MAPISSAKSRGDTSGFGSVDQYRHEIERRSALGESNEKIAAALQAKGVNTSSTTISRRRQAWGLSKRPRKESTEAKVSKPRTGESLSKAAGVGARRAEIEHRTRNGQSPGEIAAALLAQGYKLKRGASTIQRLQTVWGLVPRDPDPAKNRRKSSASGERVKQAKLRKISKRELEREANREQQSSTLHYPTNCSFGPKKRARDDPLSSLMVMATDSGDAGFMPGAAASSPPASDQDESVALQDVSAEVMSVDFLIDLATSTLSAAQGLKDMLLAYQGQSAHGGLPTTLNDLANARKKVREAAGLMLDLAADPGV